MATDWGATPLKRDAPPQSYAIRRPAAVKGTIYPVLAPDPVGAMYGGLDIAEAIRLGTLADLKDTDHSPHIPAGDQVQHSARPADPDLFRRQRLGPGQHPRDVEHGVLARVLRRDGPAAVQCPLAVEPASVPVDRQGAGVSRRGLKRRVGSTEEDSSTISTWTARDVQAVPTPRRRDRQPDDHRREDRVLARGDAIRQGPRASTSIGSPGTSSSGAPRGSMA